MGRGRPGGASRGQLKPNLGNPSGNFQPRLFNDRITITVKLPMAMEYRSELTCKSGGMERAAPARKPPAPATAVAAPAVAAAGDSGRGQRPGTAAGDSGRGQRPGTAAVAGAGAGDGGGGGGGGGGGSAGRGRFKRQQSIHRRLH